VEVGINDDGDGDGDSFDDPTLVGPAKVKGCLLNTSFWAGFSEAALS